MEATQRGLHVGGAAIQVHGAAAKPALGRWQLRLQRQLQRKLRLARACFTRDLGDAVRIDAAAEEGVQVRAARLEQPNVPRVAEHLGGGQPDRRWHV